MPLIVYTSLSWSHWALSLGAEWNQGERYLQLVHHAQKEKCLGAGGPTSSWPVLCGCWLSLKMRKLKKTKTGSSHQMEKLHLNFLSSPPFPHAVKQLARRASLPPTAVLSLSSLLLFRSSPWLQSRQSPLLEARGRPCWNDGCHALPLLPDFQVACPLNLFSYCQPHS